MSVDEVQRLILEVKGDDALKLLNNELAKEKEHLKDLRLLHGLEPVSANWELVVQSRQKIADLNKEIANIGASSKRAASPAGLLQLQYVLDDLVNTSGNWERHLASISNNIPGLVTSLGQGAGVAGAVGLITTALIALAPAAAKAWEALSDSIPKEKLEEIAAAAKKVKDELDKIKASKTPEAETTQKGFEDLFAGHGEEIQSGIARALAQTGEGAQMTPAERARIERARQEMSLARTDQSRQLAQEEMTRARQEVQAAIDARNAEAAGHLLGRAPMERGIRDRIRRLATAVPQAFPGGFAGDMMSMEPEVMEARDAEAEAFDRANQEYVERKRERRKAAAEAARKKAADDRLVDQLNRQGQEGDEHLRQAAEREGIQAQRELARAASPAAQRQRQADDYAARMSSFNQRNQTGLSDDQIQAAAAQAVQMVTAGANVNDALMAAFAGQIQQMQALRMRLQQQAARARALMMGSDFSGNFSQLPPALGY